jgi:hypothetical protein
MRAKIACVLAVVVLLIPCMCLAQAQSTAVTAADIAPFIGKWTGQHEECRSAADCEARSVEMTISSDMVMYTLSAGSAGFARHSKGGSASSSKSYPAKYQKVNGVTTMSFTTSSGNVIKFTHSGGKLTGQGTSGRFNVRYSLTKAGI